MFGGNPIILVAFETSQWIMERRIEQFNGLFLGKCTSSGSWDNVSDIDCELHHSGASESVSLFKETSAGSIALQRWWHLPGYRQIFENVSCSYFFINFAWTLMKN